KRLLPQNPARVDIPRTERIDPLDEQPSPDDLLGRAMSVPGQDIAESRFLPKPQYPQRKPELVLRANGVGDIAVLVRPVGRTRHGSGALDDNGAFGSAHPETWKLR